MSDIGNTNDISERVNRNKQTSVSLIKSVIGVVIGISFIVLANTVFNLENKSEIENVTEAMQTFDYNEMIEEEIIEKELDDIIEKYDEWSTREIDFE